MNRAELLAENRRLKKLVKSLEKRLDLNNRLLNTVNVLTASQVGRKGGLVKGKKGLAAMTPEKRAEIRQKALEARRKKQK